MANFNTKSTGLLPTFGPFLNPSEGPWNSIAEANQFFTSAGISKDEIYDGTPIQVWVSGKLRTYVMKNGEWISNDESSALVTEEKNRAEAAESSLAGQISSEATSRQNAVSSLDSRLTDTETGLQAEKNARLSDVSSINEYLSDQAKGYIDVDITLENYSVNKTIGAYLCKGAVLTNLFAGSNTQSGEVSLASFTIKCDEEEISKSALPGDSYTITESGVYYVEGASGTSQVFARFHLKGNSSIVKSIPIPVVQTINENSNNETAPTAKAVVNFFNESLVSQNNAIENLSDRLDAIESGGVGNIEGYVSTQKTQHYTISTYNQSITSKIKQQSVALTWTLPESSGTGTSTESGVPSFTNNFVSGTCPKSISGTTWRYPISLFTKGTIDRETNVYLVVLHINVTSGSFCGNNKSLLVSQRDEAGTFTTAANEEVSESAWVMAKYSTSTTDSALFIKGTSSSFAGTIDKAYMINLTEVGYSNTTLVGFGQYSIFKGLDVVPGQDYTSSSAPTEDDENIYLTITRNGVETNVYYPQQNIIVSPNDVIKISDGSCAFDVEWTELTPTSSSSSSSSSTTGSGLSQPAIAALITLLGNAEYKSASMSTAFNTLKTELGYNG